MTESRTGQKYRGRDASSHRIVQRTGEIYILWELQQRCVIAVAVVVVSFFRLKPFHQLKIEQQLDTLADKHTNCFVTSLPVRNAKRP